MNSGSSTTVSFLISWRSAGSWIRDGAKVAGVTSPSWNAAATKYGMLWSAVSRVSGFHFSASVAVRRTASPYVATCTESISAVATCCRNSSTWPMGPWVWITDGYALKLVPVIRNGLAPPPKPSHFGASTPRCCHSPFRPWKGSPGPVIPSAASSAANTPIRTAAAVAQPFHIESSPIRVTPSGTPVVIAMEMAFPMAFRSNPRIMPVPQVAPMAANIPWSQPFRGTSSASRQNTS